VILVFHHGVVGRRGRDDVGETSDDLLSRAVAISTMWQARNMGKVYTGNGPWPMRINGPLRTVMLWAGACRACDRVVSSLMLPTISCAVSAKTSGAAAEMADAVRKRRETILANVQVVGD